MNAQILKSILWFNLIFFIILSGCKNQTTSNEDITINADMTRLESNKNAVKEWKDMRFGMFIHWGPCTVEGVEIGWSRGVTAKSVKAYDQMYKRFNPVNFNADEWVKIAKATGMKYITIISKHHDGFCMWDTKHTNHNIMNSPFGRDVIKELSEACSKNDMKFGIYYSVLDWYNPDWIDEGSSRTKPRNIAGYKLPNNELPNMDRYKNYMKKQLTELLTNYGEVSTLWFDGAWSPTWTKDFAHEVDSLIRKLRPELIYNNRLWPTSMGHPGMYFQDEEHLGDFETPEKQISRFNNKAPWESCMPLTSGWSWRGENTRFRLKSSGEIIQNLVSCAIGDGNFLLNVAPNNLGVIEEREVELLKGAGEWLEKNGESIYGTRGGPFYPDTWGGSTYKGKTIYLHVLNWPEDDLLLPPINQKILENYSLTGGVPSIQQTDEYIKISLNKEDRDSVNNIIVLKLDKDIKGMISEK